MGHADCRDVENRTKMQREAGTSRMIPAGRVYKQDIGALRQGIDHSLEEGP